MGGKKHTHNNKYNITFRCRKQKGLISLQHSYNFVFEENKNSKK